MGEWGYTFKVRTVGAGPDWKFVAPAATLLTPEPMPPETLNGIGKCLAAAQPGEGKTEVRWNIIGVGQGHYAPGRD